MAASYDLPITGKVSTSWYAGPFKYVNRKVNLSASAMYSLFPITLSSLSRKEGNFVLSLSK